MGTAAARRGSILLAALVILSLLSVLAATFLASAGLQLSIGLRERDRGRARALARSGLERARYQLGFDGTWAGTGGEVPVGDDAGYSVSVTVTAGSAVTVTAVGRHGERSVTLRTEGALRPYFGTIAMATQGGSISAQEGNPSIVLEVEGNLHIDDPTGSGIVSPEVVSVSANVLDEQTHAFTLLSLGGAYLPGRADRPFPTPDLAALRAAATVVYPRDGAVPATLTGPLTGLIYIEQDRDIDIRDATVTGTLVFAPIAAHTYKITLNRDVVLDGRTGPAAGLALCAPTVSIDTVGRTNVVIHGVVYCGRIDLRGDPAEQGGITIFGRVLAALPAGGMLHLRPTNGVEVRAATPLLAYPLGLTGGSMMLDVARMGEQ